MSAIDVEKAAIGMSDKSIFGVDRYPRLTVGDLLAEALGVDTGDMVSSALESVGWEVQVLDYYFEAETATTFSKDDLAAIFYDIERRIRIIIELHRRQREALREYVRQLEERKVKPDSTQGSQREAV